MFRSGGVWLSAVIAVAVAAGTLAAWLDFHADEPQPAALVIVVATVLLAAAQPRLAWLSWLLVGLAIPVEYLIALPFWQLRPDHPSPAPAYTSLIAMLPAALGTGVGLLTGKMVRAGRRSRAHS